MVLLVIDTSGKQARVALVKEERVVTRRVWENSPEVGMRVLEHIESMLAEVAVNWKQIGRIVVHRGPRDDVLYFSGLRTGISTAMMISFAKGVPVVGVSGESLEEMILIASSREAEAVIQPQYQ